MSSWNPPRPLKHALLMAIPSFWKSRCNPWLLPLIPHFWPFCKSYLVYLQNISRIQSLLTQPSATTLNQATIGFRLDYFNSFLTDLWAFALIPPLAYSQNTSLTNVPQCRPPNSTSPWHLILIEIKTQVLTLTHEAILRLDLISSLTSCFNLTLSIFSRSLLTSLWAPQLSKHALHSEPFHSFSPDLRCCLLDVCMASSSTSFGILLKRYLHSKAFLGYSKISPCLQYYIYPYFAVIF